MIVNSRKGKNGFNQEKITTARGKEWKSDSKQTYFRRIWADYLKIKVSQTFLQMFWIQSVKHWLLRIFSRLLHIFSRVLWIFADIQLSYIFFISGYSAHPRIFSIFAEMQHIWGYSTHSWTFSIFKDIQQNCKLFVCFYYCERCNFPRPFGHSKPIYFVDKCKMRRQKPKHTSQIIHQNPISCQFWWCGDEFGCCCCCCCYLYETYCKWAWWKCMEIVHSTSTL